MKRFLSVLLVILLVPVFSAAFAEGETAGFTVPDEYKTLNPQLDRESLPADLPATVAVVTGVSFKGSNVTVKLSEAVPSVSVVQPNTKGTVSVRATAENVSSITAKKVEREADMTKVILSWPLAGGTLDSVWLVWTDNTFNFMACTYTAETEEEERVIELDSSMTVLSDTRTFSSGFGIEMDYDASGALTGYACAWNSAEDGLHLIVRAAADRTITGITYGSPDADVFDAVSDPVSEYLSGNGLVMSTVDYEDYFIDGVKDRYPQLPAPDMGYPIAQANAGSAKKGTKDLKGSIWAVGSGEGEYRVYIPYYTTDPLFLLQDGKVVLNTEAKDAGGNAPSFGKLNMDLPAFELPAVQ